MNMEECQSGRVLVVSVYYNRAYCVDESVQSLIDQTYRNTQIVLWDDASTDDTYRKLMEFKAANVLVRRSTQNQGLTKCLIQAIRESDSEFIAIHGSGDISLPERIEKQVLFLNANQHIGICGCSRRRSSEVYGSSTLKVNIPSGFADPMQSPVMHGEVMFRRRIYNAVGGYRPFFIFSQDYDLWLRMRDVGTQFGSVDQELYSSVSRRDGVTGNCIKLYFQSCYAGIAYQAHLERKQGRPDVVEQHGKHALLLFEPNRLYSRRMGGACLLAVFNDNLAMAKRAAYESLRGGIRIRILLTWGVLCLCGHCGVILIKRLWRFNTGTITLNRAS